MTNRSTPSTAPAGARIRICLALTLLVAFVARAGVRLHAGERSMLHDGYTLFLSVARTIAARHFALGGVDLYGRPPVYPYLLALAGGTHANFIGIVTAQSMVGVGTVLCTYLVARELFSARVGLVAALVAAVYPYYVVHDTAIQETATVALLSTLSTYAALVAVRRQSVRLSMLAGVVLGATVLTRLTMLPFAALTIVWLALWTGGPRGDRARRACAAAAPVVLLVVVWLSWNRRELGRATLSDGVGSQFWMAHNPGTFSAYPDRSIDLSRRRSMEMLSPRDRAEYASLRGSGSASEQWFARRALSFVRDNPGLTLRNSTRMLVTGFSWRLSPRAPGIKQLVYAFSYAPVAILGLLGAFLSRARWRELGVVYANFAGFVIVTACFWAHTSHRVHLDVFLMIFAAFAADRLVSTALARGRRRHAAQPARTCRPDAESLAIVDTHSRLAEH